MNLKTELLQHQKDAVRKMMKTRIGALFMEMGTGKSLAAIALVKERKTKTNNVIWFCPVSLKLNVKHEILKHTDCESKDICLVDGRTNLSFAANCFWLIVGIESMSSSIRTVTLVEKTIKTDTMVIVDESSYIKGHLSKRTKRITALSQYSKYRLILTGTPISQGIVDLYSQLKFLSPKILGYSSFYSFAANHLEYSEDIPNMIIRSHNVAYLAAKMNPYVYTITKQECLDLPEKVYTQVLFELTDEQQDAYRQAKDEFLLNYRECDWDSTIIFRLLTALQQIVSGFRKGNNTTKGDKVIEYSHNRLRTMLDVIQSIAAKEQIIVWAKYVYDIQKIHATLVDLYGLENVSLYYGLLSEKQRSFELTRFRQGAKFFIGTPSCGGHGLTLNEASYVIFYNNGFKYSERIQAEDRCHRIGQVNRVTYIDLISNSTIDHRITSAFLNKENVVDAFKKELVSLKRVDLEI